MRATTPAGLHSGWSRPWQSEVAEGKVTLWGSQKNPLPPKRRWFNLKKAGRDLFWFALMRGTAVSVWKVSISYMCTGSWCCPIPFLLPCVCVHEWHRNTHVVHGLYVDCTKHILLCVCLFAHTVLVHEWLIFSADYIMTQQLSRVCVFWAAQGLLRQKQKLWDLSFQYFIQSWQLLHLFYRPAI